MYNCCTTKWSLRYLENVLTTEDDNKIEDAHVLLFIRDGYDRSRSSSRQQIFYVINTVQEFLLFLKDDMGIFNTNYRNFIQNICFKYWYRSISYKWKLIINEIISYKTFYFSSRCLMFQSVSHLHFSRFI